MGNIRGGQKFLAHFGSKVSSNPTNEAKFTSSQYDDYLTASIGTDLRKHAHYRSKTRSKCKMSTHTLKDTDTIKHTFVATFLASFIRYYHT